MKESSATRAAGRGPGLAFTPEENEIGTKGGSMGKSEFRNTVVLAAANSWDGVRMADRQLAEALSVHSPVLYVDPPQSVTSRLRERGPAGMVHRSGLRMLAPGLARLTPEVLPGLSRPGITQINARLTARQIRCAVSRLGGTIGTTVEANLLSPVMGKCGERLRVYWAQDDFVGMAPLVGMNPRRFARAEAAMAQTADIIVAANPTVADSLREQGHDPALIPFGCDIEVFSKTGSTTPASDVVLAGPMAVFMGHLGDRIDVDILDAVARSGVPLLIVGPRHRSAAPGRLENILERPNVQWMGPREFEELPEYLAHASVGILPYNHSRFNQGSFPLKTLEYLAASLPVVATALPAILWLNSEHIDVADSPDSFAKAVMQRVLEGRDDLGDISRREFAAQHSWQKRAEAFARLLGIANSN